MEDRRRALLGLPLVVLALAGGFARGASTAAAIPAAAIPAWDPPPCPIEAVRPATAGASTWFRLGDELDRRGSVTGRGLVLGVGDEAARRLALPPESFVAGPYPAGILVGDDAGGRSRLRLVRPEAGCAVTLGVARDVVRSAVLAADGSAVLEHRVDRHSRDDRGVWRRPLTGGATLRILEPRPRDRGREPTWATDLAVGRDGSLAVVACGPAACRARVLDPHGAVHEVEGVGPLVGLAGSTLLTYAPCPGLPCAIEAVSPDIGVRRVVDAAGVAAIASDGETLVHEPASPAARSLHALEVRSGIARTLGVGASLLPASARAGAGAALGDAQVLVLGEAGELPGLAVLDVRSADLLSLEEVRP